jgi:hypothetical protein
MPSWVAISAINAAVHSMSQLPSELQQWDFVRVLVRNILDNLLNPHGSEGRGKHKAMIRRFCSEIEHSSNHELCAILTSLYSADRVKLVSPC